MAQLTAAQVQQINDDFILAATKRNYAMPAVSIVNAGQNLDIELESVPGYAKEINLTCLLNLDITVAAGGTKPNKSIFAPYNIFRSIEVSLGGGPFQRVNGAFYWLREMAMRPGYNPLNRPANDPAYVGSNMVSVPAVNAPAGATTTNTWRFNLKVPLQVQEHSVMGLLPFGNSSTKAKIRLSLTNTLYGDDQYASPLYGGSGVSAAITPAATAASWVAPNIKYFTQPSTGTQLPIPQVEQILNVQERATSFVGSGALTPVKFPDPFHYLRLWHVVIDGTGAPNSDNVTNFELDLTPGYPKYNYNTVQSMQDYYQEIEDLYEQSLPQGVYVFDLWSGSDPRNPNGTQTIDGTEFQTLQTQLAVDSSTNTASPAKIITFAEALSPVAF